MDPQYAVAYSNRCADFVRKPDPDRAIADCSKAIEMNPKYPAPYFNRGVAHERKRAYDQAIADQSKAIEINPKYARAYNARAWAYMKAGKAALGLPDVQRALELRPDDAAALDTRGHILEKLGKRKEAIEDFRQRARQGPYARRKPRGDEEVGRETLNRAFRPSGPQPASAVAGAGLRRWRPMGSGRACRRKRCANSWRM